MSIADDVQRASRQSTCQKRATVCAILDDAGSLLSISSNRCDPPGGSCVRLGLAQTKDEYDVTSECNWTHAEIMALRGLPENAKPHRAVLWGHDFFCQPCEDALRDAGVQEFEIRDIAT